MNFSYNNYYQSPMTRYKTLKPKDKNCNNSYEKSNGVPDNAKSLENQLKREELQYNMQGIEPSSSSSADAKPVQRLIFDPNYSTPKETYLSKQEALELFSQKELDTYFNYNYVTKSSENGDRQDMWLAYVLKRGIEINGEKITTVQQLREALGKNNDNSDVREKTLKPENEKVDNSYTKSDGIPSNAKPLENQLKRKEPQYGMQGIKPSSSSSADAKPVQRLIFDPNYSTPKETYLSKQEALELFSQKELDTYFNYNYVTKSSENGDRQDMWLAYVLKSGIEINGKVITTIKELVEALGIKND